MDKLQSTNARLSALIRNLQAGILLEDEQGKVQQANAELAQLFRLDEPPEALVGQDCEQVARRLSAAFEDPDFFLGDIRALLDTKRLVLNEELPLRDGRTFERDYIPIFVDDAYRGHLWKYRDITARLQAQQELLERGNKLSAANAALARAARLKDEFLAAMSHELRTPLNSILGMAEALQVDAFGPMSAEQRDSVAIIEESGRHLLRLINDILDLSKAEAGRMELSVSPLDPAELCASSVRMVREPAHKKRLRLLLSVDPGVAQIQADPVRLKQILVNLLSNAVKFTPEGGTVCLEVRGDAEHEAVHFLVSDTGIGIAAEDMQRLFQPFIQLDSALSRQHAGTGLGLSLVRKLAELHGGGVSVESVPNEGSCFTVALPWGRAEQRAPEGEEPAPPRPKLSPQAASAPTGPCILLAEDRDINAQTLERILRAHGYRVALARNGAEALQKVAQTQPALILMDIHMPGMGGLEAIQLLRQAPATSKTPIVALTALAMPGDEERCLRAGASAYLSKPVAVGKLIGTLRRLLREEEAAPAD